MNTLNTVLKQIGLTVNEELIKALTHNSFDTKNNSSRYVFCGMYVFKAKIADWIFENIGGTGTQLQQYYGNISSDKYIANLFAKWALQKHIRYGNGCNVTQQQHIFVYGLLGYIYKNVNENIVTEFIFRHFILHNDHLMPNTFILKDNWQRLQFFCKQQNWEKPKIVQEILPNKKHSITIIMQPLLSANHCSISPVYAKKKAINMALKQAIIYLNNELVNTPSHNLATQILLTKKEREKNELRLLKATAWNRKQEKKKQDKCILQELKRKKQIELDIKRRKTKQNIKKEGTKKGKDTLYRKYTQEEIAAMSVSKRRNLQDRGII